MDFLANTQAKDIMTRNVICVYSHTSIIQLSEIFVEHEISAAPVLDNDQKVIGFVSQLDIVELDLHSDDYYDSRMEETGGYVQDIMVPVDTYAKETDSLATLIDKMWDICIDTNAFGYSAHYEAIVWKLPDIFRRSKELCSDHKDITRLFKAITAICKWLPYKSTETYMGYEHEIEMWQLSNLIEKCSSFEEFITNFEEEYDQHHSNDQKTC